MKHFMELFVCFRLKQALWRHHWEEKSTGPNELSVQFYYAPEMPIGTTAFAAFNTTKYGADSLSALFYLPC